jgi:hypothetical protein
MNKRQLWTIYRDGDEEYGVMIYKGEYLEVD